MRDDDSSDTGPRTRLRPNPGGRRAIEPEARPPVRPPVESHTRVRSRESRRPVEVSPVVDSGLNPLVGASTSLLLLAAGLRGTGEHRDVNGLYDHILREIKEYEEQAASSGCSQQTVLDGRYALCTFIDEVVMNTPWGSDSIWATRPLLLRLHGNTKGGEILFQMIDHQLADSRPDRDLLELLYVCLSLGFEGQHRVSDGGQRALADIRDRLYSRIRTWRDTPPSNLADHWHGVQDRRSRLVREVPAWVMLSVGLVAASVVFFPLRTKLGWAGRPVQQKLLQQRQTILAATACCKAPAPPPPPCVSLAELLKAESPDDLSVIDDPDGTTSVVLRGSAFPSASADVPKALEALLARVAAALGKAGGSVQVEGHSDDLAIRSLKFQDNYDLSEARAKNAARELQKGIPPGAISISFVGLGPDEPRHMPANDPANRVLNRRVEIVHRSPEGCPP